MNRHKFLVFLFLIVKLIIHAQEKLSLQQAIIMALKNNYGIQIAQLNSESVSLANNWGQAGALPSLSLNSTYNLSNTNVNQELSSGSIIKKDGAASSNLNASIGLSWTLFDGFKMFASKNKLEELKHYSELQQKMISEQLVADVVTTYYSIAYYKQLRVVAEESYKMYEERLKIAKTRFETESSSKMDFLQATADLNAQRSVLLQSNRRIKEANIKLNTLLKEDPDFQAEISDSLALSKNALSIEQLKAEAEKLNVELEFFRSQKKLIEYQLNEAKASYYPLLSLNAAYTYQLVRNQAGFLLKNNSYGFNGGLQLTWTLFNGRKTATQISQFKSQDLVMKLTEDQAKVKVNAQLKIAYGTYLSAMEIVKLEEENQQIAKENVKVALERFRLGLSIYLEVLMAQKTLEEANTRWINAMYEAKLAETEMNRLSGKLIK